MARHIHVEADCPRSAALALRSASRDLLPGRFDAHGVGERLGRAFCAGLSLDLRDHGDRIAVPSVDRDAAVLTRIDAQRAAGWPESRLADDADPGAIVPAVPALCQPFVGIFLSGERAGGHQEQQSAEGGACRHDHLDRDGMTRAFRRLSIRWTLSWIGCAGAPGVLVQALPCANPGLWRDCMEHSPRDQAHSILLPCRRYAGAPTHSYD